MDQIDVSAVLVKATTYSLRTPAPDLSPLFGADVWSGDGCRADKKRSEHVFLI